MVKFVDVDPNELEMFSERRRGRVSYPILKTFLETNKYCVMIDRTGMSQSLMSLTTSLNAYVKNHDLPIKIINRRGQIYLLRLDLDSDGNKIENWREALDDEVSGAATAAVVAPAPITKGEVAKRYKQEKDKGTK